MRLNIKDDIMNTQFIKAKGKLILFGLLLILLVLLVFLIMKFVYASYETDALLNVSIDEAIYIFGDEKIIYFPIGTFTNYTKLR